MLIFLLPRVKINTISNTPASSSRPYFGGQQCFWRRCWWSGWAPRKLGSCSWFAAPCSGTSPQCSYYPWRWLRRTPLRTVRPFFDHLSMKPSALQYRICCQQAPSRRPHSHASWFDVASSPGPGRKPDRSLSKSSRCPWIPCSKSAWWS